MSTLRENEYLKEYEEFHRVISVISNENFPRVHRWLSKHLADIESHLDRVTDPDYQTLTEILTKKLAEAHAERTASTPVKG